MYIIKNALRCIGRSKGRNVLISIITLVIAVSACIGLSIRQAAESAKKDTLEELNITAAISYDRSSMMNGMTGGEKFDREQFAEMMGNATALTVEDYEKYASAESVEDFYYTVTAAFNGTDELLPVTDETVASESESDAPSVGFGTGKVFPGGKGGFSSSDFSVIGYSSDSAMTAFIDGTADGILAFGDITLDTTTLNLSCKTNGQTIRHSKEQSEVYLSLNKEHSLAKLSVINKGDEIPQEQREQIFERFYRADTARNSEDNRYGLGLAIAKAIAVSHKGKIEVQCYDGLVEFKVQIPAL